MKHAPRHQASTAPRHQASIAEHLFRFFLHFYPRGLRRAHGAEMLRDFRDLERRETAWQRDQPAPRFAAARWLLRTLADAATGLPRAHRWERQTAPSSAPPLNRSFGKEASLMHRLLNDFTLAARLLRKSPGFTLVAALTLAVAIGANTAIFSVVYGVLLRPIGVEDAATLAQLNLHRANDPADVSGFSPAYYEDLRARSEGHSGVHALASYLFESVTLLGDGAAEELGTSLMVDGRFFEVLGVEPLRGRTLAPEDVRARRRGGVCVISEALWQGRFGADPAILGRTLVLDGEPVVIVGVMPDDVPLPQVGIQLWMPQGWDPEDATLYNRLSVLARLEAGSDPTAAGRVLARTVADLGATYPRFEGYTITPRTFRNSLVGTTRPALLAASGAVGLILLIACINIAGLLLARAATREREMATRRALGAQRRQVVSQLLAESLLLSSFGGVLGVVLAFSLHRLLLTVAAGLLPRLYDVKLDLPVLAFAVGASLLTGLLFGLAPIAYTFTHDLASTMRGSGGQQGRGTSRTTARSRQLLLVAQIALAVTLVAGAALMVRSLSTLRLVDPGFRIAGVGGARIYLDGDTYATDAQEAQYFRQLLERLRARPDLEAVGATSGLPMDPLTIDYDLPYTLPGDERGDDRLTQAFFRTITPGYLETLEIPLLRGRPLAESDHADGEPVALINETFARLAWPDRDPVGESFAIYGGNRVLRVVGVVGDVRFTGPGAPLRPEFFVPYTQITYGAMTAVARGVDGASAARSVADEALALDPTQPVNSVFALADLARNTLASNRFYTLLLVAFAVVALLLAATGLYGAIAFWVNDSRRELGVRMALGADGRTIVRLVLRRGLVVTAFGLGLGLLGAVVGARALEPFLFEVRPTDGTALSFVVALLFAVALVASLVPALRAARIDPMRTLRLD